MRWSRLLLTQSDSSLNGLTCARVCAGYYHRQIIIDHWAVTTVSQSQKIDTQKMTNCKQTAVGKFSSSSGDLLVIVMFLLLVSSIKQKNAMIEWVGLNWSGLPTGWAHHMRLPVIEVSGGGHYRSCCGPSNLHECQFFCIISVFVSFATPLFKHAHKTLLVTAHQFSFILLLFATSSNWITTRQSINSIVCQCVCVCVPSKSRQMPAVR